MATLTELFFSGDDGDALAFVGLLRKIVKGKLRDRNLYRATPMVLGYLGTSWRDNDGSALEELVLDAYEYNLIRKNSLAAQRAQRANIDGLFRLNVDHFLTDLQRAHDPLGFNVYQNVIGGIERATTARAVTVAPDDGNIRGDSLVKYRSWSGTSVAAESTTLRDAVFAQGDVAELLAALPVISESAQVGMEGRVSQLHDVDSTIDGFHCRDLAEPLKVEVRARHGEAVAAGDETTGFEGDGDQRARVRVVELVQSSRLNAEDLMANVRSQDVSETIAKSVSDVLDDLIRHAPGWTQKECAARLGVRPQRVNELLTLLEDAAEENWS